MNQEFRDAPNTPGRVLHSARCYDLFSRLVSLGRDRAIREQLIELAAPTPGENVLDVGCGTGTLVIALKPKVGTSQVHGIDASPEMIAVAKEKVAGSDVGFQIGLIEAIPFPDGSFDLVTSSLMLHHLPDDLKRTGLAEIRRVLKPGGRFMAVDFAAGHSHTLIGHVLLVLGLGHARGGRVADRHGGGQRMVDSLPPMLTDAGFNDVEVIPTRHKNFAFIRAR